MSKGLQRSLSRGPASTVAMIKRTIVVNAVINITGVDAAVDAGTAIIGDFPEGNILLFAAVAYVSVSAGTDAHVINNWNGDYAIGTVPQNNVDLSDAGEANIIASTALDAGAGDKIAPATRALFPNSSAAMTPLMLDNTDGSLEINLNLLVDDNVITDAEVGTFTVTGTLYLVYTVLGDD